MTFYAPYWLLLLLVLPLLYWWQRRRLQNFPKYTFAQPTAGFQQLANWKVWAIKILPWLRWLTLVAVVVALARPQRTWQETKVNAEALDIVLAIDLSPSMLSLDFKPDRLTVAKQVLYDFAEKRPYDRLGLVAFSAEAFTRCPLTSDRTIVQSFISSLETGRIDDGTAIGMGLATALNQLKDSHSKTKLVILVTDGENNAGYISPEMAADMAKTLGIRVYTVGIGTEGVVMAPSSRSEDGQYSFAPRHMKFDTELLQSIAAITDGKFYRAYSAADLNEIYDEIDRLEKTKIEVKVTRHFTDYFQYVLALALACLLVEFFLRWYGLRTVNSV